jgi:hypothetical protein
VKPKPLSEAHIQNTCTQLLELDGWRALRTDPVSRREWGKGFGELGMADHLYIRYGELGPGNHTPDVIAAGAEVMWIEFKRLKRENRGGGANYTTASQHQKDWHARERARGALTLIAGEDFPASIEGFHAWYRESGLMRTEIALTMDRRQAYDPIAQLGKVLGESLAKCPK